jgi:hypothetical protein
VRAAHRANQLVELELDGVTITVLGILNQKHHQECDDRRARVDDQLPCVAELEYWTGEAPDDDDQSRSHECSLDGPWLVPSTSESGKKAMKDKSRSRARFNRSAARQ